MWNFFANWDWPTVATEPSPAPQQHSSMSYANWPCRRKKSPLRLSREYESHNGAPDANGAPGVPARPEECQWSAGRPRPASAMPAGSRAGTPGTPRTYRIGDVLRHIQG